MSQFTVPNSDPEIHSLSDEVGGNIVTAGPHERKPFSLIRQASGNEKIDCFCSDEVGRIGNSGDLRLGCNCLVHYCCVATHVRTRMGDKRALLHAIPLDTDRPGILCPWGDSCQRYLSNAGEKYFLTPSDLLCLVEYGQANAVVNPITAQEAEKLSAWLAPQPEGGEDEVVEMIDDASAKFIASTSKPCPKCKLLAQHPHGHHCHHISPGGGCPGCGTNFCYKCLKTAEENELERGAEFQCECGGWSNFCKAIMSDREIRRFLTLEDGYPRDSRCGCPICSICRGPLEPGGEPTPCEMCDGDCSVCLGFIAPGPTELGTDWVAQPPDILANMPEIPIQTVFIGACQDGDLDAVRQIVSESSDRLEIEITDDDDVTALGYAIASGNVELVNFLCENGASATSDFCGTSPMHLAAAKSLVEVLKCLQAHDAVLDETDDSGASVFLRACEADPGSLLDGALGLNGASAPPDQIIATVKYLLDCGQSPITKDVSDRTPQFYASQNGHTSVLVLLSSLSGVDMMAPDNSGQTCLHAAATEDRVECLHALLESMPSVLENVNAADRKGKTALFCAAEKGRSESLALLLAVPGVDVGLALTDCQRLTPLHAAAKHARVDCVRLLLAAAGAKLNAVDNDKRTAFFYACMSRCPRCIKAFAEVEVETPGVEFNLRGKFSRGGRDVDEVPPLFAALLVAGKDQDEKSVQAVRAMIGLAPALALDVIIADMSSRYRSVLHVVAELADEDNESTMAKIMELLLGAVSIDTGADMLNAKNFSGQTPLHLASSSSTEAVLKALLSSPAAARIDIDSQDNQGQTCIALVRNQKCRDMLIEAGATAKVGYVLYNAAEKEDAEKLKEAMARAAAEDINFANPDEDAVGQTPLYIAARTGNLHCVTILTENPSIDVNLARSDGATPLATAAYWGRTEVVQHLVSLPSINLNQTDQKGESFVHAAIEGGKPQLLALIVSLPGVDLFTQNNSKDSLILYAAQQNQPECLQVLASLPELAAQHSLPNKRGVTPLLAAAREGFPECVAIIARLPGIDVNQFDSWLNFESRGWTALYVAAHEGRLDAFRVLVALDGIDLNHAEFKNSMNALMIAAAKGHDEILESLIRTEAKSVVGTHKCALEVNKKSNTAQTALHLAISANGVRMLLSHPNIDANILDCGGRSALLIAIEEDKTIEVIRELIQGVAENKVDVNLQDNEGRTALMLAALRSNVHAVRLLLALPPSCALDVNLSDIDGNTACHLVCSDCAEVSSSRTAVEILQLLVSTPNIQVSLNQCNDQGITPLMEAMSMSSQGLSAVVTLTSNRFCDVNVCSPYTGNTALHCLSAESPMPHREKARIVAHLLNLPDNRVDLGIYNILGYTAFLEACRSDGSAFLVKAFISAQGSQHALHKLLAVETTLGMSALHVAACLDDSRQSESVGRLLLEEEGFPAGGRFFDSRINASDLNGRTALFHAVAQGHLHYVELFLGKEGIDLSIPDTGGMTVLELATLQQGHEPIMKALMSKVAAVQDGSEQQQEGASSSNSADSADSDSDSDSGDTADVDADSEDRWECATCTYVNQGPGSEQLTYCSACETLRTRGSESIRSAWVCAACTFVHQEPVMALLSQCSICSTSRAGPPPSSIIGSSGTFAACMGLQLYEAAKDGRVVLLQELVTKLGTDHPALNWAHYDVDRTPFYVACKSGQLETARLLSSVVGVDVAKANKNLVTPLKAACAEGHPELVKLLCGLERVRNSVNMVDCDRESALMASCRGVDGGEEMVKLLLTIEGIDVNMIGNGGGMSALHHCAENNLKDAVRLLLDFPGIEVNARTLSGRDSALTIAALHGHSDCLAELLKVPEIDVNWVPNDGERSLHRACQRASEECVRLLVTTPGIDLNAVNFEGETALFVACRNGYSSIVKILVAAGADINLADFGNIWPLAKILVIGRCDGKFLDCARELLAVAAASKEGGPQAVAEYVNKAIGSDGKTCLHYAVSKNGGNRESVELLLAAGADAGKLDKAGRPPSYYAQTAEILQLLPFYAENIINLELSAR